MKKYYRLIMRTTYLLGLLSLLAAIAARVVPQLRWSNIYQARGALEFAAALFLCAICSYVMIRLEE